jgi:hypothetical protein
LTADIRCSMHPVSPYGCAFDDGHIGEEQPDRRSIAGLNELAWKWRHDGAYGEVWGMVCGKRWIAPEPEARSARTKKRGGGE